MIKLAICDDERQEQNRLLESCIAWLDSNNMSHDIHCFSSGEELLASKEIFHGYFLDMRMEGVSGLTISEFLSDTREDYIVFFVSGYDEFMEFSFGKNVYGYLTKPLVEWKFNRAMEKLSKYYKDHFETQYICLTNNKEILVEDIVYIQSDDVYTTLYMETGDEHIERMPLNDWEELMQKYKFCRVQKSIIINAAYIETISIGKVSLKNGLEFAVGKQYMQELKRVYMMYRKRKARY